jgi:DNA-binding Xre family transcriptional regulator
MFRRVITNRIEISNGEQDIRFNLMAVVPDRRISISHKLKKLRRNKEIVEEALEKLVNGTKVDMSIKEEVADNNNCSPENIIEVKDVSKNIIRFFKMFFQKNFLVFFRRLKHK